MLSLIQVSRSLRQLTNFAPKTLTITCKNMSASASPITRLSGKIAIVTASTDGIGFAIAQRLAQEGAQVVVSSRKQNNVDAAISKLKSEGLNVTGIVCHVSKADHRKKLLEVAQKLGGLDILVSNAAVNPSVAPVLDCDESSWVKIFDVNVKASFLLAKEALPLLRQKPYGRIIFVASIAGFHPFEVLGAYSVSKTALIGLTKAAAVQLARENITVNCIAPGIIQTKFSSAITETDEAKEEALSRIPMNRLGVPRDISGAAAYLASEDASYVTGETLIIAGGMPSRLIGFAIAQRLAQEGAKVILSSRKQNNVDAAVSKLKSDGLDVTGLVCHVSNPDHRKKLFEEIRTFGGLDILVSNAAVNPSMAPVLDCDESAWDKIFEVNVKAAFLLAKEALPFLRRRPGSRIIFVSSIAGFQPIEPFESLGAYSVSKTALVGLTKAAAVQLAKENITVNCVAPGIVQTKFSKILVDDDTERNKVLCKIPMNRLGLPQDISGAVAFLASEDASYITGETIIIAGGMASRL
ncbi:dehydrogenase/reductase SDR family member 4 [Asbolus verrucosus]|uniref:Dehydrogenase/reductase SDR family member 4 n=1 Tax=Asbolus verrucosus TaxID=1661398 RepID=A0A482VYH8_ASBVE|nr:dehydrogenase/reductase SDR family member 4 [Asbolus verrucosus]